MKELIGEEVYPSSDILERDGNGEEVEIPKGLVGQITEVSRPANTDMVFTIKWKIDGREFKVEFSKEEFNDILILV